MDEETTKKIESFHKLINSEKLVEGKWYRRNHSAYELVCYINNIVALYLSDNYESIPVFIDRAKKFLSCDKADFLNKEYRDQIAEYLMIMEREFAARNK